MLLFFIINVESKMLTSVVIHGSMPPDYDWVDDNGTPLPYLPSSMDHTFEENATRLMLTSAPDGISFTFSAISPGEKYNSFACEI